MPHDMCANKVTLRRIIIGKKTIFARYYVEVASLTKFRASGREDGEEMKITSWGHHKFAVRQNENCVGFLENDMR